MVKMSGTFEVEPRKNAKFKWTSLSLSHTDGRSANELHAYPSSNP